MLRPQTSFKTSVNSLILFVSSLIAHVAMGGSLVSLTQLVSQSLLILLALTVSRAHTCEGPKLALVVLATQSAGHLILGSSSNSSLLMIISHGLAGFSAYKLITHFDSVWDLFEEIIIWVIPNFFGFGISIPSPAITEHSFSYHFSLRVFIDDLLLGRSPPRSMAKTLEEFTSQC